MMKLFSRTVSMVGPPAATMGFAAEMRSFVAEKTGRDLALWAALFGAPSGTFVYAMRVDGVADFRTVSSGLLEDPEYHEKIATGAEFVGGPSQDQLGVPIHGELGDESPPVGAVAGITTATIANGMYERAFAWGVEMAQHSESITGVPTVFLANQFGPFGGVTWIGVLEDAAASDAANEALWSDAGYMKRLGEAGDLFAEGSGHQTLMTRVA